MKHLNQYFVILAMGLCLTAVERVNGVSLKGSRPNIVFFLGDDQAKFDHTAYGNTNAPTPVTGAFALEGLVFERAYTGQAICAPSRSMLYTGRYPVRNGCYMNHSLIRPRMQSLPELLEPHGYTVVLAGKSHVKPAAQFPWSQYFSPVDIAGKPRPWIPVADIQNFLANPGSDPFCLIVTSEYPHGPFFDTTPYSTNDIVLPPYVEDTESNRIDWTLRYRSIDEKEAEFQAVLDAIDANGLQNDTIVFYSDDHGTKRGKFTVYDSGLNVAFMVRWPGMIAPGRTDALTSYADFVPTVIELAGGTVPAGLDGNSMLPVLDGSTTNNHEYVYGVTVNQGIINRHVFPQRSVHDGRYHYIHNFNSQERISREGITNWFYVAGADQHPGEPEELLFDTLTDPYELTNRVAEAGMASITNRLKEELFRWMTEDQYDYLVENVSTPLFLTESGHELDILEGSNSDPPTNLVGALTGLKVEQHTLTDPNAEVLAGADIVAWNNGQMPGAHNSNASATLDENVAEVTAVTDPGYTGQPIYRAFQEEGNSVWSVNANIGLRIRWNANNGVAGEKSSGLFLFKEEDFLDTLDPQTEYTFAMNGVVNNVKETRITNTTIRAVLKDTLGYHISDPVAVSASEAFTLILQDLVWFTYNPLTNTATEAGTTGSTSTPAFVDLQFVGFRLDASRGVDIADGENFGLGEYSVSVVGSYGTWVLEHNLFGGMAYDEDRDGYNNLYEYALGGNPVNASDHGYVPSHGIKSVNGTNVFEYVHAKRLNSAGELAYLVETRTNLVAGTWTTGTVVSVEAGSIDGTFEAVTNRVEIMDDETFIRLKIESL